MKEGKVDVLCLLEGVLRREDLQAAPGVGSGTEVVHWVRVANQGPIPQMVHDGLVMVHWGSMEEKWREDGATEKADLLLGGEPE